MSPLKYFRLVAPKPLSPQKLGEVYSCLREAFGDQRWWPGDTAFEIIIGAILTQNTAWTNVEKAILNLKRARKLTPSAMARLPRKRLAQLIRPTGYFNIKAERLGNFLHFLENRYQGNLKKMFAVQKNRLRRELLEIKGIGPETADSILLYAGKKPSFVIDAYTKRIFSRHRLYDYDADYHEWQSVFTRALPVSISLYNDFHAQIVHLGKFYCQARRIRCQICPLRRFLV